MSEAYGIFSTKDLPLVSNMQPRVTEQRLLMASPETFVQQTNCKEWETVNSAVLQGCYKPQLPARQDILTGTIMPLESGW